MKSLNFLILLCATFLAAQKSSAQPFLVSASATAVSAVGGGNSYEPILTPDGRFVLFASSANNLAFNTNGNPWSVTSAFGTQVYLRDRLNQTTSLVSVDFTGNSDANDDSFPMAISTNGQFALFESAASNLVPNDTNGLPDVFVRDLVNGTTTLVSVGINGVSANGPSHSSVMTPDGRFIAFSSAATNLVAGDTNQIPDVFVRDLISHTTTLVSVGAQATNYTTLLHFENGSDFPQITPDGRYVAFFTTASNLVSGVATVDEIFVRDLVAQQTTWASVNARSIAKSANNNTNIFSFGEKISDDGQYVTYEIGSRAASASLAMGSVARFSLVTGLTDRVTTNLAGFAAADDSLLSSGVASHISVTPDGRFVAFVEIPSASSIVRNIYVWDGMSNTTVLASPDVHNNPLSSATCEFPVIDSTGRYVCFLGFALNLVTNNAAVTYHLYQHDLLNRTNLLVDLDTNGASFLTSLFSIPEMTPDGRFIAFEALDGSLVPGDNNHAHDVFLRDMTTNTVELISARATNAPSFTPNGLNRITAAALSSNGQFVAFASDADNLVPNDTNGCRDVFVHDNVASQNTLVSVGTNGASGAGVSVDPAISATGRYVAFSSTASNLVAGDTNNLSDVFVRDLQAQTTTLVSVANGPHRLQRQLLFIPHQQ